MNAILIAEEGYSKRFNAERGIAPETEVKDQTRVTVGGTAKTRLTPQLFDAMFGGSKPQKSGLKPGTGPRGPKRR